MVSDEIVGKAARDIQELLMGELAEAADYADANANGNSRAWEDWEAIKAIAQQLERQASKSARS